MKWFFIIAFYFICQSAFCQPDSSALLKEAEGKLQNHSEVSGILSDKRYVALHPLASFRELIKQYASPGILTIVPDDEPGKKIRVLASVRNKEGKPVANALVYLYQTDARGWYAADAPHVLMNEGDFRQARWFGYAKTDKNGMIELHTIKPSGYPQSDLPAHIHVHVLAEGYRPYGTEFLFEDDERLKGEILNRAIVDGGMIGKPEAAVTPFQQKFTYVMTIKNNN